MNFVGRTCLPMAIATKFRLEVCALGEQKTELNASVLLVLPQLQAASDAVGT